MDRDDVRQAILDSIVEQGFQITPEGLEHDACTKDSIRRLHAASKSARNGSERSFIHRCQGKMGKYFASGSDIDIDKFSPIIQPIVREDVYSDLFRYATSLWSVPVSRGFGRRQRFLVIDKNNDKLVGLFALGDPVFNLAARDKYIGWNANDRVSRLYNVMDIFILGAVPPYSNLLCGKLVALLATSNEVRKYVYDKYIGTMTNIQKSHKNPSVVFLTTTSALGRSSLYNRITFGGARLFEKVGYTKGWGHFHFHNKCEGLIEKYLKENNQEYFGKYNFGDGPNWKIRMLKMGLKELGLPQSLLKHKISRELFGVGLASNYKDFLTGKTLHVKARDLPASELIDYFKERWFIGRASRDKSYLTVSSEVTCSFV
jgi:hypothetical protein